MRHRNPLATKKLRKWGGGICLFVSRENKRIKPPKFSKSYLPYKTSLIPQFSHGDTQTLVKKGEGQKSEGGWGKEEGEVASWLS